MATSKTMAKLMEEHQKAMTEHLKAQTEQIRANTKMQIEQQKLQNAWMRQQPLDALPLVEGTLDELNDVDGCTT